MPRRMAPGKISRVQAYHCGSFSAILLKDYLCTNVNVEEVSQRILRGTFAMIMLVDLSAANMDFTAFSEKMSAIGTQLGVDIRCTRQELYDAMHKV